ncbi:hypothetical protein AB0L56_15010 [Streptomyces sp. NPDC052079]|uniref:hypothetical protein n=1 Tax=Streptomyces sp. NPDC052079 TaxID=3155526 RepID=UPI00342BC374
MSPRSRNPNRSRNRRTGSIAHTAPAARTTHSSSVQRSWAAAHLGSSGVTNSAQLPGLSTAPRIAETSRNPATA